VTVVAGSLTIPAEATPRTSGEEFFRTEGAYTGLDEPIPGGQIARWLLVEHFANRRSASCATRSA
jgi:hypothetical protein